jgi:hypothetical protein
MPDNQGEHDPLESWLSRDVRPLPPPPGTFELITRRARRRKLRKLSVTVVSTAAVAVAAVFAVPSVFSLHMTPSTENGSVAANGTTQAATGTPQPDGTATRERESPRIPASPSAVRPTPAGPVPANFQPVSVTFVSANTGWAIGQAGTPGHCATQYCTSIVRTSSAGLRWAGIPAPETGPASGRWGVSGIRFLDGVNGWAFGPELWATHDSGNTWHQVSTGGKRVTDLETAGDRAYALFALCTGGTATNGAGCTSYTLMTTTARTDNWAPVGAATSGVGGGGAATSAVLALTGSAGYLVAPDGTLYSGPQGSPWGRAGTVPCQPGTQFALVNSAHLAVACPPLANTSAPRVFTSDDSGATWTARSAGWPGTGTVVMTSLTAAPDGTLVLATKDGTSVLPDGASQWKTASGTPAGGFSYVGMTTDTQGVAVPADASAHEIWMTFDGGAAWTARPIS